MHHLSNLKCNATGLAPEHSMVLPERVPSADEVVIMDGLFQLYTKCTPQVFAMFAPEVIYTMPNGNVVVGLNAVIKQFTMMAESHSHRLVRQRLLHTPESLSSQAMVIDQTVSNRNDLQPSNERNLIVLKRREHDGLITSLTEEAGHRRATVPLAARAASANLFNSPTDNMVSPCTSKLNLNKRRHHLKGKPTTLFAGMTGMS
ncbi:hypothetical protein MYAM1_003014 [Malassezia yamatoensis]|uniref:Uncharacterized protein n=1 Tax=Malassezia yamatoensis TaxID=253288 RepID=A0AAJ5YVL9_9BASI|nr:hypothetical protein MYAM1_003014 [Malassezia yamatoensis]